MGVAAAVEGADDVVLGLHERHVQHVRAVLWVDTCKIAM